jgi:hypothetical protein
MDIKYIIFDLSELDKINFDEVLENSGYTLRLSNNGKSFIKYKGEMPPSIQSLTTKSNEYTNSEILDILNTSEWYIETITFSGDTI